MSKQIRTLVAIASLPLLAGVANAADIANYAGAGACQNDFYNVALAIESGVYSSATNRTNLLLKLDGATAKVSLKKFDDAVSILVAIGDRADELAGAPKAKLNSEAATAINATTGTAILCVGGL